MTPRTLHLLRHGALDPPGHLMGRTDALPTPAGVAACLAKGLSLDIVHVVTSDLQRACHPAQAIAAAGNLPLTIDARWRELDFGTWDGLAPETLAPPALTAFWADPDADPPPEGERWSTLVARIAAAIDALPSGPVLVITHGGPIRAVLHLLCGISRAQLWAFDLPYAVHVSLQVWPGDRPNAQVTALVP